MIYLEYMSEHMALKLGIMDPYRASSHLCSIQHEIVMLRSRLLGMGVNKMLIIWVGGSERMVRRLQPF
jgi:hypothetical protein